MARNSRTFAFVRGTHIWDGCGLSICTGQLAHYIDVPKRAKQLYVTVRAAKGKAGRATLVLKIRSHLDGKNCYQDPVLVHKRGWKKAGLAPNVDAVLEVLAKDFGTDELHATFEWK